MAKTTYLQMDPRTGYLQEAHPPKTPDNLHDIPNKLAGERGSLWDTTRLFEWYEEGLIFLRGPVEDFQIEAMLRTDGRARAVEQVLTLPVRGARWTLQKADGDSGELAFAMDLLTRPGDEGGMKTPLAQVISQLCSAYLYRSACFEKVFTLNDQKQVVYDKIAYRPPTTCYLARSAKTAELHGFLQWTWTDIASFQKIYIPQAKAVTYLHGIHRDPILGSSDIEVCYRSFETKQKLRFLWMAYLENQVIPKMVVTVRGTGDEQQAGNVATKVASLKGGGVVGLTEGQAVEKIEPAGNGGTTFQNAINYLDEEMYASVLAGFLSLTTATAVRGGGGSFALSLSATDFFEESSQARAKEMAQAITHQVIAPMIRWNFGRQAKVPQFKFTTLAPTQNIAETVLQIITTAAAQQPIALAAGQVLAPSTIPGEFWDELIEYGASMLDLDPIKIHQGVEQNRKRIAAIPGMSPQAAGVHAATDALTEAVLEKGGKNGHSTPAPAAA